MSKECLECGMIVYDIFDPCPACGTRPFDPNIRKGESKESYDRTNGRERFLAQLQSRATAAKGLEHDILTTVPILSDSADGIGLNNLHDAFGFTDGDALSIQHQQQNLVRRHGGGIPHGVSVGPQHSKITNSLISTGLISLIPTRWILAYRFCRRLLQS